MSMAGGIASAVGMLASVAILLAGATRAEPIPDWMGPAETAAPATVARFEGWRVMLATPFPDILATIEEPCQPVGPHVVEAWFGDAWREPMPARDGDGGPRPTRLRYHRPAELHVVDARGQRRTLRYDSVYLDALNDMVTRPICRFRMLDGRAGPSPDSEIRIEDRMVDSWAMVLVSDRPIPRRLSVGSVRPPMEHLVAEPEPEPAFPSGLVAMHREPRFAAFLQRDRRAPLAVLPERDLWLVKAQVLRLATTPGRGREVVVSAFWYFESSTTGQGLRAWAILRRSGRRLEPLHLSKQEGEWIPLVAFYPTLIADLDGDGIDEMIGRRLMFEGDGYGIMTWEAGRPVYVSR